MASSAKLIDKISLVVFLPLSFIHVPLRQVKVLLRIGHRRYSKPMYGKRTKLKNGPIPAIVISGSLGLQLVSTPPALYGESARLPMMLPYPWQPPARNRSCGTSATTIITREFTHRGGTPTCTLPAAERTVISLNDYRWRTHCRGLYQLPVAA